jgi:hypothetical protein
MLKINFENHQNLIMIWTYENVYGPLQAIQKSITFFIKVFLTIFLHLCSYCFDISYIESIYKISQIKTIHKNACIKRQRKKTNPYISTSNLIKLYLVYINTYINKCIFTQVENINLITNFAYCWFFDMLVACKCMTFYTKITLWCEKWTTLPCNHS